MRTQPASKVTDSRPTALYRLYDASNVLLYVGIAYNPDLRIPQHSKKPWYSEVHRQHVEWFPNRAAAELAETTAIQVEDPLHNIQDHPVNKPKPPKRYYPATPAHGMTNAKFHMMRHLLGLTGDWMAAHLDVSPRTVRTWESGQSPIPEWAAQKLEQLLLATAEAVRECISQLRDQPHPVVITYRNDAEYQAAHPNASFSASWHRAAVARARVEVPGLRIVYGEPVQ